LTIYPKPLGLNLSGSTTPVKPASKKSKKKDKKLTKKENKKSKKDSATKKYFPPIEFPTES
jgi:hypothetical protein